MTADEIIEAIITLAEGDQSISDVAVHRWIAQGIDRINMALHTSIPNSIIGTEEPQFDKRFHESLVLFGIAKYRESDSDYAAGQYFLAQFEDMVRVMQRDMVIQPSIRTDYNVQQIVVTNILTFMYTLTIPSGSYYDTIKVYRNDSLLNSNTYMINVTAQTLTLVGITLVLNDKITVEFENNSDLNDPPYQWWGNSGW